MPTQWKSAPAAMTTSASRSVIPWSRTIDPTTPAREQQARQPQGDVRDDLDVDPRVVGHLQALGVDARDVPPRLDLRVGVDGLEQALEPAVAARRRTDAHVGQRVGERGEPGRPRSSPPDPRPRAVTARAWVLFAAVSVVWGVPYFFIKVAVDADVPPAFVAWSRIALGAALLLPLAARRGPLRGLGRHRAAIAAYAACEIAVPFTLIAVGEQHVSSSLAAILIASMPLMVAVLSRLAGARRAPGRPAAGRPGPGPRRRGGAAGRRRRRPRRRAARRGADPRRDALLRHGAVHRAAQPGRAGPARAGGREPWAGRRRAAARGGGRPAGRHAGAPTRSRRSSSSASCARRWACCSSSASSPPPDPAARASSPTSTRSWRCCSACWSSTSGLGATSVAGLVAILAGSWLATGGRSVVVLGAALGRACGVPEHELALHRALLARRRAGAARSSRAAAPRRSCCRPASARACRGGRRAGPGPRPA